MRGGGVYFAKQHRFEVDLRFVNVVSLVQRVEESTIQTRRGVSFLYAISDNTRRYLYTVPGLTSILLRFVEFPAL